ncbi:interferon-inducible GTPase 1 isoform X1 [Oryctolagus cuniculus]|uniref:interferon-inducible GTPase 1 isoform X1 n=2 Tax=Oryctolagus cuniculus TaxID=9986 RepID=UPI0038792D1F
MVLILVQFHFLVLGKGVDSGIALPPQSSMIACQHTGHEENRVRCQYCPAALYQLLAGLSTSSFQEKSLDHSRGRFLSLELLRASDSTQGFLVFYLLTVMGASFSAELSKECQDLDSSFKDYIRNFREERKILSQETILSIKSRLSRGDIQGAHSIISGILENIDKIPLNIAVTGESGSGKSSLVNSLRGVGHEEEDAAPTGVEETTIMRTPYKHPKFPNVTIWDLPGIGTTNFQPKDYLEKVKFGEYDFFIIVSATRFKKNDLDLAKVIKAMKKNFYFVRTKVDLDLQNEQEFKPTTYVRDKVLEEIRNKSLKEFKDNNIETQIFLISNKNLSEFDFPILMETLLKDLPAQKRHAFTLSLPNITEAAIDRKRDSLKQIVWLEAFKAGISAIVPAVGIIKDNDVKKLKASLHQYQFHFGVDDTSLQSLAKDLQVPVEELKAIIKSPYLFDTEKEETTGEMALKFLEISSSVAFPPLAAGLYFMKVFYLQFHFLDIVTSDAKVLLKKS